MSTIGSQHMSRRRLLKGLVLAGAAGLAASCAPAQPQLVEVTREVKVEPKVTSVAPGAGTVTVRVHARMGAQSDHFDRFANIFNQQNFPKIFVKSEHFPGGEYYTKIDTMIAGGTIGDIFWISSVEGFSRYSASGAVMDLDGLVAGQKTDLAQYLPGVIELSKMKGKLMGLPWAVHPGWIGLYYNKAMYDQAGVKYPTNELITEDFATGLKKLTDKKNNKFGWAPDINYYYCDALIRTFGGTTTNKEGTKCLLDSDQARSALQYFHDLMFKDQVTAKPEEIIGGGTTMFGNNQVANLISGFWVKSVDNVMQVKNGWGVAPAPKGPGKKVGSVFYFDALCLTSKSKYPAEAFQYMLLETGKDAGMYLWQVTKSVPGARPDVLQDPESVKDPHFVVYADALKSAESPNMPANFRELEYTRAIGEGLNFAWTGQKPLATAIADTQKAAQAVLDKPSAVA